jgi:4-diphosphocytidyl-2-C-methyl-D-erythritol kinase
MTASPPDRVRIAAHAKVNLFLRILARESNGYHQIETAFALLELADELEVSRTTGGVTIDVSGADVGPAAENLAVRAATAVLEVTGKRFGVAIKLAKRIPVRAGLGGGSSDAAAALAAVNRLAGQAVPQQELMLLAAKLGADVAFFASAAPLALAWGRGERMYRLPALPPAPVLLAIPAIAVATPDAYRWWDQLNTEPAPRGPVTLDAESLASWGSVGRLGGNDFEIPVFGKHPELRALYERLAATKPYWVRMSGSGSAIAAVYRNERDRDDAAMQLGEKSQQLIRTMTRASAAAGPAAV